MKCAFQKQLNTIYLIPAINSYFIAGAGDMYFPEGEE
jgi:hypothetical protein